MYEYLKSNYTNIIFLDGDVLRRITENYDYSIEGRIRAGHVSRRLISLLIEQGIDVVWCSICMSEQARAEYRKLFSDYYTIFWMCH